MSIGMLYDKFRKELRAILSSYEAGALDTKFDVDFGVAYSAVLKGTTIQLFKLYQSPNGEPDYILNYVSGEKRVIRKGEKILTDLFSAASEAIEQALTKHKKDSGQHIMAGFTPKEGFVLVEMTSRVVDATSLCTLFEGTIREVSESSELKEYTSVLYENDDNYHAIHRGDRIFMLLPEVAIMGTVSPEGIDLDGFLDEKEEKE